MNIQKNTFGKEEKLCSEKDIDSLYKTGQSFLNFPLVFYHLAAEGTGASKVLISVSKKKFKNAVDRNLVKRRLREAYRLHKSILSKVYHLGFVYIGNEILPYEQLEKAMVDGLQKIETAQDKSE